MFYGVSQPRPIPIFWLAKVEKKIVLIYMFFRGFLRPRRGPGRKNWHLGGLSIEMVSHTANLAST